MAKKNDGAATGCGCLVLIGLACYGGLRLKDWYPNNEETVAGWINSGIEIAKQVGMWGGGIIVACIILRIFFKILKKIFAYRKQIKHWEQTTLQEFLNQNSTEKWLSLGESEDIVNELEKIESSLPHAEQRLHDVQRKEKETNERK